MRIVAGLYKGRKLFAPEGASTRPTSDRARESVFNILAPVISGARVLDLFAGSGAMGLEALSRGASEAVLNDIDKRAFEAIKRNVQAALGPKNPGARLMNMDYLACVGSLSGEFDIVFLDPPYKMIEAYPRSVLALNERGAVSGAIIVMELAREAEIGEIAGFETFDERNYGAAKVRFARKIK